MGGGGEGGGDDGGITVAAVARIVAPSAVSGRSLDTGYHETLRFQRRSDAPLGVLRAPR